jgi:hypothetical protein
VTLILTDIFTGDVLSTIKSFGCSMITPLATSYFFQNKLSICRFLFGLGLLMISFL